MQQERDQKRIQTIAVDVDDVLVPHGEVLIEHLNRMFAREVKVEGFYSLDELMAHYGETREDIRQQIHEFLESDEFAEIEPVEESITALRRLQQDYHLTVVTARPGITHRMTREWLTAHFPDVFAGVHFANADYNWGTVKGVSKQNICQTIAADYLIDDSLRHIQEVAECGMKGILFGNYHWNKTEEPLPPHAVRVADWQGVLGYFYGE